MLWSFIIHAVRARIDLRFWKDDRVNQEKQQEHYSKTHALTFDAKDNPNLSCEEPCYDLAPATIPVKPCFPFHARHCNHSDDCCGDSVCGLTGPGSPDTFCFDCRDSDSCGGSLYPWGDDQ